MKTAVSYSSWDSALALGEPWHRRSDLGDTIHLKTKENLYFQGDHHDYFYVVHTGFLQAMVHSYQGHTLLLEIFGPGSLFGEASAFLDEPRHVSTTAITACTLSRYQASALRPVFQQEPELAITLIQLLGLKHRTLIHKLLEATCHSARERLEALLFRIAHSMTDTAELHLTHEQMAHMSGLSRVTVTRILKTLSQEGVIRTRSKGLHILKPEALLQRIQST